MNTNTLDRVRSALIKDDALGDPGDYARLLLAILEDAQRHARAMQLHEIDLVHEPASDCWNYNHQALTGARALLDRSLERQHDRLHC
ncbi:MAG: hypothetical protein ACYTF7_11355 [Planctomycetota bacterium]|jgi:hypothetical protein